MSWLRKLFGKGKPEELPVKEAELADTAPLKPDFPHTESVLPQWKYFATGSAQSAGLERESNEDSLLTLFGKTFGEDELEGFGLFCVADGAGGQGHGMLASSLAIKTAARQLVKGALLTILQSEFNGGLLDMKELFQEAFERANDMVLREGQGGVTTLTAAMIYNDEMIIGHVGDSRAYTLQEEQIKMLTRDHSFPWRLVEIGQLSEEEAREHPKRNLLWNAIGQADKINIDIDIHPIPRGGHLLICSDGLWAWLR